MEIERYENKLLDRVELNFTVRHQGKSTPSRKDIMDAILTQEKVSNPDLVIIKNCNTRFGQALTTGVAYIYDSEEAMKVEPSYIHKRHEVFRASEPEPEAEVEQTPAESGENEGESEGDA